MKDQALSLLPGPSSQPVEIAGPLQRPPAPYLFGYIDWSDEFAWWTSDSPTVRRTGLTLGVLSVNSVGVRDDGLMFRRDFQCLVRM